MWLRNCLLSWRIHGMQFSNDFAQSGSLEMYIQSTPLGGSLLDNKSLLFSDHIFNSGLQGIGKMVVQLLSILVNDVKGDVIGEWMCFLL